MNLEPGARVVVCYFGDPIEVSFEIRADGNVENA